MTTTTPRPTLRSLPRPLLALALLAATAAHAGEGVGVIPHHRLANDLPEAVAVDAPTLWITGDGSTATLWLIGAVPTASVVELAIKPGWDTSDPVVTKEQGGVGTIPRHHYALFGTGVGEGDAPPDGTTGSGEPASGPPNDPVPTGVSYGPIPAQAGEATALLTVEGDDVPLLVFTVTTIALDGSGMWQTQLAAVEGDG